MIEFSRIRAVENPHCSNYVRGRGLVEDLRDAFPDFYDAQLPAIETSPDPRVTIDRIREGTRPGDLLAVVGGDGTIGAVAQAIAGEDVTMLPLWSGNGNDGSRDLNGEWNDRPIHELIKQGVAVDINPLQICIGSLTKQAINYYEIGSNAKGARLLNSDFWRHLPGYSNDRLRLWYEAMTLPPVAFFSKRFPVTENGETRELVNFTAAKSHYLAKLGRLPIHLDEPRAFMAEVGTQLGLLPSAVWTVRGTLEGTYLEKGDRRTFIIGRTVLCHADAETDVIEKGSTVELSIAENPFRAVSYRAAQVQA